MVTSKLNVAAAKEIVLGGMHWPGGAAAKRENHHLSFNNSIISIADVVGPSIH